MGHRVYFGSFGSSLTQYDTLREGANYELRWPAGGDAALNARNVTTLAAGMPVRVACNTISSIAFGGSVRGWTLNMGRRNTPRLYEIDCDDWTEYLDRQRPCASYTSLAVDSVVRHLVGTYASSFSASGVHTLLKASGATPWPSVTVQYTHNVTLSDAITSLVAGVTPPDASDPPTWGVTPDRVVHLVGALSSYSTTLTVDDTNADLRGVQVGMIGNEVVTRAFVWGGSAHVVNTCAAGASSIRVYQNEMFWGPPTFLTGYPVCSLYVANGTELIPVVSVNTATGDGTFTISSLNISGATHAAVAMSSVVRAVVIQRLPDASINMVGSLTGESGYWDTYRDAYAAGWPTNPISINSYAYALMRPPAQEVSLIKLWTVNSQAVAGGRLAVSLTAAGIVPGLYTIRSVRVSGFDRGDNVAPIYEIEAGPQARYRVDSLL